MHAILICHRRLAHEEIKCAVFLVVDVGDACGKRQHITGTNVGEVNEQLFAVQDPAEVQA